MPELPEVETVCKGIEPHIVGRTIDSVKVLTPKLRIPVPTAIKKLPGAKILSVKRKAKYILIELSNQETLVIHLGMSGRLTIGNSKDINYYHRSKKQHKHDHLIITLDNGKEIVFNDTRKFGLVDLIDSQSQQNYKFFKKLGVEPLEKSFSKQTLKNICKSRSKNIKAVIMDANLLVGVGNIYACEALFLAGVDPRKEAGKLTEEEITKLRKSIVQTLRKAIKAGGSTIQDYAKADGNAGYFQHQFNVYDREGKPCKKCQCPILRFKDNGRSTYYCETCQD